MTRIHNEGSNDSIVQAEKIQSLQSNLGLGDHPPFRDKAKQFLRRIRLIPFYASFTKKKIDLNLPEKLRSEAEGILAWLVEGAVKYYAEGLKEPRNFKDAYKSYKRFEDAIGSFIDNCVEYSEGEEISANKLYDAYREYCSFNNCRVESLTVFGRRMSKTKYVKHKRSSGYVYLGAKLVH